MRGRRDLRSCGGKDVSLRALNKCSAFIYRAACCHYRQRTGHCCSCHMEWRHRCCCCYCLVPVILKLCQSCCNCLMTVAWHKSLIGCFPGLAKPASKLNISVWPVIFISASTDLSFQTFVYRSHVQNSLPVIACDSNMFIVTKCFVWALVCLSGISMCIE